jgi:hypothetical protein
MIATCIRDCWDGSSTRDARGNVVGGRYFTRGYDYDIELDCPCIIHFQALPGTAPEEVNALTQAQRAEVTRGRKTLEAKRAAKKQQEEGEDDFSDMKLVRE